MSWASVFRFPSPLLLVVLLVQSIFDGEPVLPAREERGTAASPVNVQLL